MVSEERKQELLRKLGEAVVKYDEEAAAEKERKEGEPSQQRETEDGLSDFLHLDG